MAIIGKTTDQIQQDLINFVVSYNTTNSTNIDYRTGTVFRDIVIDAPSVEFGILWSDLVTASEVFSVNYASQVSDVDVDNLAANYGLTRNSATKSTTTQEFLTTTEPTSDIIINAGTIVATQATAVLPEIQFQTTATVTLPVATNASYKIIENGITKWRITAPVIAVLSGANGNVGSNTITQLKQAVTGINTTRNSIAATGGSDQESNTALASRIQLKLSGNNVGTENGIKSLMLTNTNVKDVSVVKPGDPELTRNEFGGSIDVYIDGEDVQQIEDQYTYTATNPDHIFVFQPASGIISVTGIAGGVSKTFVEGIDFIFVEDVTSLYTGSTRSKNVLRFNIPGGVSPDDTTLVTVDYLYNKLIYDLQTNINLAENHIVASDILIREAIQAMISMVLSVTLFPGYSRSVVTSAIQTAVSTFIDDLTLGQSFNKSDIIAIIESVPGVDSVDLNTFTVSKNGVVVTTQTVTIFKYEYTQFNTLDIIILV